ncbi:hypothetical protein D918_08551 [Trichuris suis]|nr:hypothetical protein D918_08551 [Trichuris suis]
MQRLHDIDAIRRSDSSFHNLKESPYMKYDFLVLFAVNRRGKMSSTFPHNCFASNSLFSFFIIIALEFTLNNS